VCASAALFHVRCRPGTGYGRARAARHWCTFSIRQRCDRECHTWKHNYRCGYIGEQYRLNLLLPQHSAACAARAQRVLCSHPKGHIAILEALSLAQHRAGATFTQILDTTEQSKSTLNKSLHRLIERGLIAVDGRTYTLTDAGRHELAATTTVTEFASSPAREAGELAVNWHVSYHPGEADSPHQGAEFTPSSPVVHSEFADLGERGELPVNWPAADPHTEGRLPLPNAEFTEFTRDCELVHSPVANSGVPEFTEHLASQCASSPEFTISSPTGSPSQFTSSPSPRFWKRGQGELAKNNGDEPLPDEPPPGWQISQAPRTGRRWATNGKGLGEYHRTRESALAWAWTNTTV
jgi:predicted transcriptional regulator